MLKTEQMNRIGRITNASNYSSIKGTQNLEQKTHFHLSGIACHLLATKAIRRWSKYTRTHMKQRRMFCRAKIRDEVLTSSTAFSIWQYYVQSKIIRRRCLKVFRRKHSQSHCSAPLFSILRDCFFAWSTEFVHLMIKERQQYAIAVKLGNKFRLRRSLEHWENMWGSKLEMKLSLFRSILRIDIRTAAPRLRWFRMKERLSMASNFKQPIEISPTCIIRGCKQSSSLYPCPLLPLKEKVRPCIVDFVVSLFQSNIGICRNNFNCICYLRRWFLCWKRMITRSRNNSIHLRAYKLSVVKNYHVLLALADCISESRSLALVRNSISLWSKLVHSRKKKLVRCNIHFTLKPALLHWVALTDEAALGRLRLEFDGESSFFSKNTGDIGDRIMLKSQQQQQLRLLKAKRRNKEDSCKTYCNLKRTEDKIGYKNEKGPRHLSNIVSKENSISKLNMSSSSIKDLWGYKSIDDCNRSTYLGQYKRKESF